MSTDHVRGIQTLRPNELELFVDHWMSNKAKAYSATQVWAGTGDKGRDVVGFLSPQRFEGPWHLFQAKQLKSVLRMPDILPELAKVFHHANRDGTSLPAAYHFIAPQGAARAVLEGIGHPTRLRQTIIDQWDQNCATKIVERATVPLTSELLALIHRFDFSSVHLFDVYAILKDPHIRPTLVKFFGADPGPYASEGTPDAIADVEENYLAQIVQAYEERARASFPDVAAVLAHGEFREHLWEQRTRYFEAAYFKRHYRDNTLERELVDFGQQIYHGVVGAYRASYPDTLARIDGVTDRAASVVPAGILAPYARVEVKQGFCHHLANEGRLPWKR